MMLSPVQKRKRLGILILTALSSTALVLLGLLQQQSAPVTFEFVLGTEWIFINQLVLDSKTGSSIFSIFSILVSIWAYLRFKKEKRIELQTFLGSFALLMAFICWAASGKMIPFTGLLQGALLLSVPIIFGAMAGLICERSGVINIAIEGQLLAGAFIAGVVASLTSNTTWGLLSAPIAGALISLLLAIFAVKFSIDQVILGFVINVLVIGITNFLYKKLLIPYQDTWNSGPVFSPLEIPILSNIPIIGPVFFYQTIIVYLMYVVILAIHFSLFRTRWGLRTRAVGEHPTAADSVGINVNALRFKNVIISGLVAGLGGAYFTIGAVGAFGKEMTAGKGFIALAALIFGRWNPVGAVLAALLFGFTDNLQGVLSITGTPIPSEFMLMAPYIVTIIVVSGFVGRVRAPAADGIPYSRGNK